MKAVLPGGRLLRRSFDLSLREVNDIALVSVQGWTVRVYRDLPSARKTWEDIYKIVPEANPFMTWQYASIWWKHFGAGSTPFILMAFKQNEPAQRVLLPLMRTGGDLRWLATPGPDNVGLLYNSPEALKDAIPALVAAIRQESWSKLSLNYLKAEEAELFTKAMNGMMCRAIKGMGSPYISIEGKTWEQYRAGLSHSRRRDIKAVELKQSKAGQTVRIDTITDPDKIRELFPIVKTLINKGFIAAKRDLISGDKEALLLDICTRYAAHGWLKLDMLYMNDVAVAFGLCFTMKGVTGYWMTSFDEAYGQYSPGKTLLVHLLHASFTAGDRIFDFMHGLESYKLLWTKEVQPLTYLIFYRNPLHGHLANFQAELPGRLASFKARLHEALPKKAAAVVESKPPQEKELSEENQN